MGLAASQARFLGITLRKANCEFQSTQLAEERLRVSNQLSDISQEYSNAMNATKLMWCNDMAAADYGLAYSLLMMPSAVNDYNPYFVSSKSGAIILNSNYAAAARAAGIGMAGCVPSEAQRNAFIEALSGKQGEINSVTQKAYETDIGMATKETTKRILEGVTSTTGTTLETPIEWDRSAGMGAAPEDKGSAKPKYLSDIINDPNMGGAILDWLQMYTKPGVYTETDIALKKEINSVLMANAKNKYLALEYGNHSTEDLTNLLEECEQSQSAIDNKGPLHVVNGEEVPFGIGEMFDNAFMELWLSNNGGLGDSNKYPGASHSVEDIIREYNRLLVLIDHAKNSTALEEYKQELENLKQGKNKDGKSYADPTKYGVIWAFYDNAINEATGKIIKWGNTTQINNMPEFVSRKTDTAPASVTSTAEISMETLFQTNQRNIESVGGDDGDKTFNVDQAVKGINIKDKYYPNYQITVIKNGVIMSGEKNIRDIKIADLLTDDIVIMDYWKDHRGDDDAIEEMSYRATKLLEYIATVFGYGNIGTGLNIDLTTDKALEQALEMTKKKYLKSGNAIFVGNEWSASSPSAGSAFNNANDYNRIGADEDHNVAAINLSNMVSAFLTYYDNYLRDDSEYYVGKSNDNSNNQMKTSFVTDDPYYTYITADPEQMSNDQKIAMFYDELYNNLCARGWREDGAIDQYDYLESTIKDGRYQLMSLSNADGHYYQTRYNETGYMKEVKDQDAITRAEAEYTQKKAELSYKEDAIDMKTKKLDAEIAELNTEISSVQNMISKSIEKTFNMFQS